jgi:hypothetical protein
MVVVVGSVVAVVGALTGVAHAVTRTRIVRVAARGVDMTLMVSAAPAVVFSLVG